MLNILFYILFIVAIVRFKATVLLHTLILLKFLITEAAKGKVIGPDMAARELVALVELIIVANLIQKLSSVTITNFFLSLLQLLNHKQLN